MNMPFSVDMFYLHVQKLDFNKPMHSVFCSVLFILKQTVQQLIYLLWSTDLAVYPKKLVKTQPTFIKEKRVIYIQVNTY